MAIEELNSLAPCDVCGKKFMEKELMEFEDEWICATCFLEEVGKEDQIDKRGA